MSSQRTGTPSPGLHSRLVQLLSLSLALHVQSSQAGVADIARRMAQHRAANNVPIWAESYPYKGADAWTTMDRPSPHYKVYHNIWLHNSKYYAMLAPEDVMTADIEDGLTPNMPCLRNPVLDVANFTTNLKAAFLHGNTLVIDFPFASFQDDQGHWAEIAAPLYSVLRQGEWVKSVKGSSQVIDRILLPNMYKHLTDWLREVLVIAMTPGVAKGVDLPTIVDYADLDKYDNLGWLAFENLMVVQDRYTHPQRKNGFVGSDHGDLWRYDGCERYVSRDFVPRFQRPQDGKDFRFVAHRYLQLPQPQPWIPGSPPPLPRQITLMLQHEDYANVNNTYALQGALESLAAQHGFRFRTVTFSNEAPFLAYLDTISQTGVLVGRHNPILANSIFLPPGAMVMEILPYKWEWANISMLYYNLTQSIGDIHHYAWRPLDVKWCQYTEANDSIKYSGWTPEECHARECLVVHARASVQVDLSDVIGFMARKLRDVLLGRSVEELREPWPQAA